MNENFNVFKNLKNFYEITFDNLELVISQQNMMLEIFLESQPLPYKYTLLSLYEEWYKNCLKSLNDYKDMIFEGIDCMDNFYNKNFINILKDNNSQKK